MTVSPGDLLHRTLQFFKSKGHVFKGYKQDPYGAYAAALTTPDGLPYLLVVKTSMLGMETVSFHREILNVWNGPVVMGLGGSVAELPQEYVVFHPDMLRRKRGPEEQPWTNERPDAPGIEMVNFSIFLGEPWKLEALVVGDPLEYVWSKLKKRNEAEAKQSLDSYTQK